ncbi:MAG: hypothetical protein PT116_13790 [Aphanizomenon gracile PMC638.10]|jgi:hypothetical protein|nr:hypothetical protein [Aphanizomenon gracile PMC638.10]
MISAQELQQSLKHFTSTNNYYRHLLGIRYTDGVQYLTEEAQCYWLIDVIASHQTKRLLADQMLKDFQLWLLVVGDNHEFIKPKPHHQAVVTCWRDTPNVGIKPPVRQDIDFTDFPLSEIKLFLCQGVLMLPGEY